MCHFLKIMAQSLITATRMAANGECSTVSVRLNKRAKTATHEGCVYKQLFVHPKYDVSAYVVQDVEKMTSAQHVSNLLEVPVPIALTTKLLIAPLLWVHAHPPQDCDAQFLKLAWERALQEHTYPPLRLTKDTSLLRATPPMLRLHLSPHGAVIASTACQSTKPPEKARATGTKAKKKCAPKKKRRDDDEDEDEEETCKAEESEEIEEDESEEKEEDVYDEIEEDESGDEHEEDELDEEGDDDNEDGEDNEEEEEDIDEEEAEGSEVDDTLKSEDEAEEKVEKGRTTKRTKS